MDYYGLYLTALVGALAFCVLYPIARCIVRSIRENLQYCREQSAAIAQECARIRREEADRAAAEALAAQRAEKQRAAAEARTAREEQRRAAQAEKLEAARLRAEYRERELAAARELRALQGSAANHAPKSFQTDNAPKSFQTDNAPKSFQANNAPKSFQTDNAPKSFQPQTSPALPQIFAGQTVAFTGRLRGMQHKDAAAQVIALGGKAYAKEMPAGTTILVVGDNAENTGKLQKADRWAGQVRIISQELFFEMIEAA